MDNIDEIQSLLKKASALLGELNSEMKDKSAKAKVEYAKIKDDESMEEEATFLYTEIETCAYMAQDAERLKGHLDWNLANNDLF